MSQVLTEEGFGTGLSLGDGTLQASLRGQAQGPIPATRSTARWVT